MRTRQKYLAGFFRFNLSSKTKGQNACFTMIMSCLAIKKNHYLMKIGAGFHGKRPF
jgi:hypothetical protein